MKAHKIYDMPFSKVYPLYLQKVERKGHSQAEVDDLIEWLTGYSQEDLAEILDKNLTFREFFQSAPELNPQRKAITGLICGIRVEEIEEPLMQEIRYLDKIIDELARNKKIENIKRS